MKCPKCGQEVNNTEPTCIAFAPWAMGEHMAQCEGYVSVGDVCRKRLRQQCQYGCRYLDKVWSPEYTFCGEGLRIRGDSNLYHSMMIHHDDVETFVSRWKVATGRAKAQIDLSRAIYTVLSDFAEKGLMPNRDVLTEEPLPDIILSDASLTEDPIVSTIILTVEGRLFNVTISEVS